MCAPLPCSEGGRQVHPTRTRRGLQSLLGRHWRLGRDREQLAGPRPGPGGAGRPRHALARRPAVVSNPSSRPARQEGTRPSAPHQRTCKSCSICCLGGAPGGPLRLTVGVAGLSCSSRIHWLRCAMTSPTRSSCRGVSSACHFLEGVRRLSMFILRPRVRGARLRDQLRAGSVVEGLCVVL